MERRDFDYYEARAQDVKLEDITSCYGNAEILQQLRCHPLHAISITDEADDDYFVVGEGDDLGWLGYFIGKSEYLEDLNIYSWGEGENIESFIEGINRNRSIDSLHIATDLGDVNFRSMSPFFRNNNRLYRLEFNFEVGLECAQSIAFVLGESRCQSLKHISIEGSNLSDEGFSVIATALRTYPQLSDLYLENNNIGLMGCIALGDTMRGWETSNLKTLDLDNNGIDDQGLQALAAGMADSALTSLRLSGNLITGVGLRSFSTYFQSESCCLNTLFLYRVNFGDEGAVALADGLMGNKSLKCLDFFPHQSGITNAGWAAFSKLVCDPSSINSTYLSNHNIERIGEHGMLGTPIYIRRYLDLNERLGWRRAAIHKILKSHSDLDMEPFFQWKLKLLPAVINWFQSAVHVNYPQEFSTLRQNLQSRELSALYKFVRGMPALTVISYWQQQVINIQASRRRLDVEEETAWVRLGGRPRDEGNVEFIQIGAKRMRQE
mmetsp:Transcript_20198/g.30002  ORF Transcript_20198/g.30002 Transcript_20198/m.30002 type:complete len:493 (+) Transcript_20198:19-1497(+)